MLYCCTYLFEYQVQVLLLRHNEIVHSVISKCKKPILHLNLSLITKLRSLTKLYFIQKIFNHWNSHAEVSVNISNIKKTIPAIDPTNMPENFSENIHCIQTSNKMRSSKLRFSCITYFTTN